MGCTYESLKFKPRSSTLVSWSVPLISYGLLIYQWTNSCRVYPQIQSSSLKRMNSCVHVGMYSLRKLL